MRRTTRFRQLIDQPEILVLPGAHDALSVRLIEQAGFEAFTAGGYAATASLLGAPDIGQLGLAEMADHYARLCDTTPLPVLADADTGYGSPIGVGRTIRAYERAGVAALFIEDQVAPKRCGHMEGKRVIPVTEMVAKIKAATDARIDGDLVIMARTDARAIEGLDAAIERAQIYREAGADLIFVEAPLTPDEMARICSEIAAPCMANNVEGGKTPLLSADQLEDIGYACVAFPVAATYTIAHALRRLYTALRESGDTGSLQAEMLNFAAFHDIVRLPALRESERACEGFARDLMERLASDGRD
ncbi:oxaloacetate decarboxylase [Dongia sp.]|uniref:isocitrate lyase/PEP mutase family protein n=1 Tax=Dongia sp. TaxID=1977262 RepID=UPI0035B23A4E